MLIACHVGAMPEDSVESKTCLHLLSSASQGLSASFNVAAECALVEGVVCALEHASSRHTHALVTIALALWHHSDAALATVPPIDVLTVCLALRNSLIKSTNIHLGRLLVQALDSEPPLELCTVPLSAR